MSIVRIKQFDASNLNLGQIKNVAIKGKMVVLADDEGKIAVLDISSEQMNLLQQFRMGWSSKKLDLQIAPSSRYILIASKAYDHQRLELWDTNGNCLLEGDKSYYAASFVEYADGEAFLISPDKGKLEAYHLPEMTKLFSANLSCDYYCFLNFFSTRWLEAESILAVGYPKGEGNDDLQLFSFNTMRLDIDKFAQGFSCYNPAFLLGRAGILSVGHYKADPIVIYHDDNGMHDDEDASDELQNLDAFRGFYIFSITDKRILQRTSYHPSMKVETGDPIFATDSNVAILGKTQAEIVSKSSGRLIQSIAGDCMAIDGKLKLLIVVKDKQLEIFSVL